MPLPPLSRGAVLLRRTLVSESLSQAALATLLGVTQQSVSGWLRGRARPATRLMATLDDRFGIPMRAWAEDAPRIEAAPERRAS